MAKYFALFAAFVATAAAVAIPLKTETVEKFETVTVPPTKGCCMPNQWSAKMTILDTVGSNNIIVLDAQLDYAKKQQVMFNYTVGSQTPTSKVLIDYGKAMLYSVPTAAPTTCFKMELNLPMVQCLPEDAKYLGSSYLGPMLAGELDYDAWRFQTRGSGGAAAGAPPQVNPVTTMVLSQKQCVPILEVSHYPGGYIPDQHFWFSGFQPKLTDPSAFNLPEACFKNN
ncbi:hypothetical protein ACOMHN_026744 [Nucella lapillus]